MNTSDYPIPNAILQLGNGYNLEFDALAHLLESAYRDEHSRLPMDGLAAMLGVSDRQAKHLAALACALGLLRKVSYKPTPLGRLVYEYDPFFDDLGTLWFLHYAVSSEPRHIIWNRAVNDFLPRQPRFSREQLRASFDDLRAWFSADSIKKHVLKEINTFLDAYTQQAFNRLVFLRAEGDGYTLGYRQPVPSLVLVAAAARFRDTHRPGATAIPVSVLCGTADSPGIVFGLPEDRLRQMLEELKTQPGFSLESRADLDQISLASDMDDVTWMKRYYASR